MKPKPFRSRPIENKANHVRNISDGKVWHRCGYRVLYADTDRSQVVYHANYLRYFEQGRASLMREAGYPYKAVEASGFVYPIIEIGVTYHTALEYDDAVWIYTRPGTLERVRLQFDYVITHAQTGDTVCTGFTRHCATNGAGVPVAIDAMTLKLWHNFPK
jgi:acyl-CoA thioester hydrolase